MTLLRLLVKSLTALLGQRLVVGTKKPSIAVKADSYVSTPIRGESLLVHFNHQMVGYLPNTTLDKAQTTAIYAASVSPHGLIELSTLWAAKTQLSNAQKLDDPQRNFWKDLVVFPYHQGV